MSKKRRQRKIRPVPPGELLKEEFLEPLGMTQRQLADKMGYEVKTVNRLINGRSSVTPALALALEDALGMDAEFWLKVQLEVDLFDLREQRQTRQAATV